MIANDKIPAAMDAIHQVLCKARFWALEGCESSKMAKILDWAGILPTLVCRQEDCDTSEDFRNMLIGLGESFPECAGFVKNLDRKWDALSHAAPVEDVNGPRPGTGAA